MKIDAHVRIAEQIDNAHPTFYKIEWVPSHLSDKGKEEELASKLAGGTTTEERILGNDKADESAKLGAQQHRDVTHPAPSWLAGGARQRPSVAPCPSRCSP